MKKGVLSISLISAILFFAGVIFKKMHWPGAGILLTLGAALGVVFLLTFLIKGIKPLTSNKEKINLIVAAITMIIICIGFTFKVQHWPGAGAIIYISHFSLLISSALMFVDAFSEKDKAKQSFKTLFAFIYSILMLILLHLAIFFDNIQPAT